MNDQDAMPDDGARRLRLAELLAARLCHDLSGPLGGLAGALQLQAEAPEAADEALALARETATVLTRRLRLLRAAWGDGAEPMDRAALRELAVGLPARRNLGLDMSGLAAETVFAPPATRLVLNALLLSCECLPAGGQISLAAAGRGDAVVMIEGKRAAWPAGLARLIADEAAAWAALDGPRTLQAPLTVLIARHSGLGLSLLLPAGAPEPAAPPPLLLRLGPPDAGA